MDQFRSPLSSYSLSNLYCSGVLFLPPSYSCFLLFGLFIVYKTSLAVLAHRIAQNRPGCYTTPYSLPGKMAMCGRGFWSLFGWEICAVCRLLPTFERVRHAERIIPQMTVILHHSMCWNSQCTSPWAAVLLSSHTACSSSSSELNRVLYWPGFITLFILPKYLRISGSQNLPAFICGWFLTPMK